DKRLRRLLERAGPEYEHEAAAPRIAKINLADASDTRGDDSPQHVEANRIPDVDLKSIVHPLLHRNFRLGRRTAPELAGDDPFIRLEVIAIRHGVLTGQRAARTHVFEALELNLA